MCWPLEVSGQMVLCDFLRSKALREVVGAWDVENTEVVGVSSAFAALGIVSSLEGHFNTRAPFSTISDTDYSPN